MILSSIFDVIRMINRHHGKESGKKGQTSAEDNRDDVVMKPSTYAWLVIMSIVLGLGWIGNNTRGRRS